MYFINAAKLWIKGHIDGTTFLYALRERPAAVAGKDGYFQVTPEDIYH